MIFGLQEIKEAYDVGAEEGATHMIIVWDSFDGLNYPIYVMPGEDPKDKRPRNGDRVDECYRYSLGWDAQSAELRALHWEMDE